jgi:hypothetical protein
MFRERKREQTEVAWEQGAEENVGTKKWRGGGV